MWVQPGICTMSKVRYGTMVTIPMVITMPTFVTMPTVVNMPTLVTSSTPGMCYIGIYCFALVVAVMVAIKFN